MARFFFILAAVCIIQAYGKPSAPTKDHLAELGKETQKFFETLQSEFVKTTGYTETKEMKEIQKTLHHGVNEMAESMKKALETAHGELKAHSGEAEKAVASLKKKVEEYSKKIQEDHPTEVAQVKEHQKKIEEFYNEIAAKTKTTFEAVAKDTTGLQEDSAKFLKTFTESFKTNMEHVGKELQKVIDEHKKTH